jgi:4-amino-4-deoxy-L-arabinose transferase-like glycosyltransferase
MEGGTVTKRRWTARDRSVGEWGMIGAALAFLAITVWWVAVDARVPDADNGKHLLSTFRMYDGLADGHLRTPLNLDTGYPPLAYLVGAVGVLIGGATRQSAILAENLVFVPLLVGGCYAAGRLAYDRGVGVLAALFVLAVPMVMSLFHVMMLDGPMAALVAVTIGLLMASRRFEDVRWSLLAGVACGLGLLTKQTFVLFVLGFLVVMLARGGWRHWRGLLAFAVAAAVIAAPWYVEHLTDVRAKTQGATAAAPPVWYGDVLYPERWSLDNFTWYGWALANNILYLPLLLLVLLGLVFAVRRLIVTRGSGWEPELLAGAGFSYLSISFLRLDDPRYLMPWLVYVAVIAVAWIPALPRPARIALAGALVAILVMNTAVQNLGIGSDARISLWGHKPNPIGEAELVVLSPVGYTGIGEPEEDQNEVRPLLDWARARGARAVAFDLASINAAGLHPNGMAVEARGAGLEVAGYDPTAKLGPRDVYVSLGGAGAAQPCGEVDGRPLYMFRGGPPDPAQPTYCPSRR